MALFTELVANTCMVEIGAAALKLAKKNSPDGVEVWYEIFERITHSMTCENSGGCEYHATPPFLQAVRTSLERLVIPTLIVLREEARDGGEQKYLVQWVRLLRLLGITDKTIRERHRLDRKCCNIVCPARNSGVPSTKKNTCTECHSVFYCDRTCQKSDWENHKNECERLAKATCADLKGFTSTYIGKRL
ncbi:hypothetical protein GALMADRAFT_1023151 [Galerina marginata CBS 339.88]|uniref:MYND-type domain-containing protein n=1 Tax=Galerina marginata (strain CBS 339.88) TaxID=685588 RepID=A0A067SPI1_GALM3|nr:hypothetical protein GALMADRAFT_1023151 [Galerina marginata CBS 339.88]